MLSGTAPHFLESTRAAEPRCRRIAWAEDVRACFYFTSYSSHRFLLCQLKIVHPRQRHQDRERGVKKKRLSWSLSNADVGAQEKLKCPTPRPSKRVELFVFLPCCTSVSCASQVAMSYQRPFFVVVNSLRGWTIATIYSVYDLWYCFLYFNCFPLPPNLDINYSQRGSGGGGGCITRAKLEKEASRLHYNSVKGQPCAWCTRVEKRSIEPPVKKFKITSRKLYFFSSRIAGLYSKLAGRCSLQFHANVPAIITIEFASIFSSCREI